MHQSVLVEDLAVVLCVAAIVTVLFQKIKQPIVLGYLIAGIIVGPYTPPFSLIDDEAEIKLLAELGVIFLMFSLGLEFTFSKLTKLGLPAAIIGVFEVIFMLVVGFGTGQMLGWSSYESLLLGGALSISSTTIIIKALEEYNLKRFTFAELMVGVLLVEDLLAILLLVFVSTTGSSEHALSYEIFTTSIKLLLVISSWFLVGYFALPYVMRKIQNYINHETLTIISVGLCLFLSSVAVYFNYSAALGAFIMGSILAETPLVHKIETLTLPIRDIFAAVFFVSVGMLINPSLIVSFWSYILLLSLLTILGKLFSSAIGALLAGQSVSDSLRIGFSMAQIGEFSFIIIGLGSSLIKTDESLYPIIVAISAITTFATPYLIKFGLKISERVESAIPAHWQASLKTYREWLLPDNNDQKKESWKTKHLIRFSVNAIIVAIIFSISAQVIVPRFLSIINLHWPLQLVFWLVMFFIASPFIWAMLFSYHPKKKTQGKFIRLLNWTLTAIEVGGFALIYFSFPWVLIPILAILLIFYQLFFQHIQTLYTTLENNLINNLTRKQELDEALLKKLAPWDNELVRIKVSNKFPFVGQTLQESRLRPSFGINIVAIKRALKTLWLPNAQERILPEDELVVLGGMIEIDSFREFTQRIEDETVSAEQPKLNIQSLKIDENHLLINRPISDPLLKNYVRGLIVGLDRQGDHILNPPPHTILQSGDILLFIIKNE